MNKFDRRIFLTGTAGAAGLMMLGGLSAPARAAGPLTVGVLIPGSKSDKGWMESGYDGLKEAEKKLGAKVAEAFQGTADTDTAEPRRLLDELSHTADEQIRPDIAVIAGAYSKIVGAMEDVNAGSTDPETVCRMNRVSSCSSSLRSSSCP